MEGLTPACVLSQNPSEYCIACVEDSLITVSTPAMEATVFAKFPRFETLCRVLSEQLLAKTQLSFDPVQDPHSGRPLSKLGTTAAGSFTESPSAPASELHRHHPTILKSATGPYCGQEVKRLGQVINYPK